MSEPPAPPPTTSPSLMLLGMSRVVERRLAAGLTELGLGVRAYGALGHISRQPGISYTELARRAHVTVQSIHVTVGQLLELGAVVTEGGTVRGRAAVLRATDRGRELLDRVADVAAVVDRETFGDRTPEVAAALGEAAAALFTAGLRRDSGGDQV